MSCRELLRGKEETLLRIIHPNVLLLALLTEQDLLDECTEQAITAERTNFDRNRRLLDWLKHSPREAFDGFLRALRTNGQEHVANYIDGTPGITVKSSAVFITSSVVHNCTVISLRYITLLRQYRRHFVYQFRIRCQYF